MQLSQHPAMRPTPGPSLSVRLVTPDEFRQIARATDPQRWTERNIKLQLAVMELDGRPTRVGEQLLKLRD